jgi:adenylate kinase
VHQRDDDTPEAISHRLDLYDSLTSPLIDYYTSKSRLVVVDGLGTTEEVFGRLASAVKAAQA